MDKSVKTNDTFKDNAKHDFNQDRVFDRKPVKI